MEENGYGIKKPEGKRRHLRPNRRRKVSIKRLFMNKIGLCGLESSV
jgi:hypothetical protein